MITSLNLLSADVDHSFWVPQLFGKDRLHSEPGESACGSLPDKTGMYVGQCSRSSAVWNMPKCCCVFMCKRPEEFAAWVKNQQQPAVQDRGRGWSGCPGQTAVRVAGLHQLPCGARARPQAKSAQGKFGPDLTHFMSRDTIASGASTTPQRRTLKLWIKDPDYVKPGCLMPSMQLSDDQIDQDRRLPHHLEVARARSRQESWLIRLYRSAAPSTSLRRARPIETWIDAGAGMGDHGRSQENRPDVHRLRPDVSCW